MAFTIGQQVKIQNSEKTVQGQSYVGMIGQVETYLPELHLVVVSFNDASKPFCDQLELFKESDVVKITLNDEERTEHERMYSQYIEARNAFDWDAREFDISSVVKYCSVSDDLFIDVDNTDISQYIEKVLLDYPCREQAIVVNNLATDKYDIIQGGKVVFCLQQFVMAKIPLQGLRKLTYLNGETIDTLHWQIKQKFLNTSYRVVQVTRSLTTIEREICAQLQ